MRSKISRVRARLRRYQSTADERSIAREDIWQVYVWSAATLGSGVRDPGPAPGIRGSGGVLGLSSARLARFLPRRTCLCRRSALAFEARAQARHQIADVRRL